MIGRSCGRERDVQQAATSGRWTGELRDHVTRCQACSEVARVTSALSGDLVQAPRRVAPSIVWAKARFARRRRAEAVASNILTGSQVAIGVIGLALLAWLGARLNAWALLAGHPWGLALAGGLALLAIVGLAAARLISRES